MKISLDEYKLQVTDRFESTGQTWPYSMPRQDEFLASCWSRGLHVTAAVRLVEDYCDPRRPRGASPSMLGYLHA